MRTVYLIAVLYLLHLTTPFAQTPQTIERNLMKAFMRIDYWGQHRFDNQGKPEDSLFEANKRFSKTLYRYSTKCPLTIYFKFNKLEKKINIIRASDSLFTIYSWDSQTGGTMHFFNNVFQYKRSKRTYAIVDTPWADGDIGDLFRKIYTFKNRGKSYYLCTYMFIESTRYYGEGIRIFSVRKDTLDSNIRLIKTKSGLTSDVSYEYDLGLYDFRGNWKAKPEIYFDRHSKTINLPLITSNGRMTHRYIKYKFTGQYFERFKN